MCSDLETATNFISSVLTANVSIACLAYGTFNLGKTNVGNLSQKSSNMFALTWDIPSCPPETYNLRNVSLYYAFKKH